MYIQAAERGYITIEVKKGVLIKLILSIYHIGGIILNSGPQCALGNKTYIHLLTHFVKKLISQI